MATTPKVSVIMATYNCHDTVEESIRSIINQTFLDWEFIICDDCSTDDTYSILRKYETLYPEKILILRNEKNSKLSFSLNHCLNYARGEYIARMDADDISKPERLDKQVAYLDAHPEIALVGSGMTPFDSNNTYKDRLPAEERPCGKSMIKGVPFYHATIVMRKSAYDKIGRYTVSKRTERAQDYDMWFRFFYHGFVGHNMMKSLYLVKENLNDYKRRKVKHRLYGIITSIIGYRLLKFPFYYYIFALKPLISILTPNFILKFIHQQKKHD